MLGVICPFETGSLNEILRHLVVENYRIKYYTELTSMQFHTLSEDGR